MNKFIITESQLAYIKESVEISNIKLPDFIINSINQNKTSLGDHPSFPPGDELSFEEKILKKRYFELLNNVKKIDGVNGDISKKTLITRLGELVVKCKELEEPVKEQLEQICFELVNDSFGITYGDLDIECVLTDTIKNQQPISPVPLEDTDINDFDDMDHVENLNKEILKRRLIDSIVQGASVRLSAKYEKNLNKIYELDHRLPELYYNIVAINEYLSFVKESTPSNENVGGAVSVDLSSDTPKIYSEAIIFPTLIFETVRGVMELLSAHGLPNSKSSAEYIINKADFLLAENWDKRFGVGIWDIIVKYIENDDPKTLIDVFVELVSIPTSDFDKTMREILAGTRRGKMIMNDIISNIVENSKFNEIDDVLNKSDETDYFTPEELIGSKITETDTTSAGSYSYDAPAFLDAETADHSNMIAKSVKDGLNESIKPEMFTCTEYRLPTEKDLIDIDSHNLSGDEVYNGFCYTIIGKGIKSEKNKNDIIKSITLLIDKYPNNDEYKKALTKAKNMKPRF